MMVHRVRRQRAPRKGYTMMEILILVAMLGILLLVSMPNLVRWTRKWKIDGGVRQASMHMALAKMKAVSHGFPYRVTFVDPVNGNPTYTDGDNDTITVTRPTLVIEGREGNRDLNGNGLVGEYEDPIVGGSWNKSLVVTFAPGVYAIPPPAGLPSYTPPVLPPGTNQAFTFRSNGQIDIVPGAGAVMFVLYLTNEFNPSGYFSTQDWFAVSVNHSGRFKTHKYTRSGRWEDI